MSTKIIPNKNIGQHFLADQTVLQKIVAAAKTTVDTDTILEVGPGQGVLTERLVQQAKRVIAVELDRRLQPKLDSLAQRYPNLQVVMADILQVNLSTLGLTTGHFSVVANLPYQITGLFLRQMLTCPPYPRQMVVLVQKEVAERLVAQPGDLSILALSVQLFAKVRIICTVPPAAFNPPPAVDSALITITDIRQSQLVSTEQEKIFFRLIKAGFAQKRKMLMNNLKNIQHHNQKIPDVVLEQALRSSGVNLKARAQELRLEQWLMLVDKLQQFMI